MHLPDQSEAPRPKQHRVSTRELILRASDAIGVARVLVREATAYCEESRLLREHIRARREAPGPAPR